MKVPSEDPDVPVCQTAQRSKTLEQIQTSPTAERLGGAGRDHHRDGEEGENAPPGSCYGTEQSEPQEVRPREVCGTQARDDGNPQRDRGSH